MNIRLKTKLSLGLIFLFIVIVLFGVLGLFYINRLSNEGRLVLQNNHESLIYCSRMMQALEDLRTDKNALDVFRDNLKKQQGNITAVGEKEATDELTKNFNELLADSSDLSNYSDIRRSISKIEDLNEMAIARKNAVAQKAASGAKDILTILFTILT